MITDDTLKTKCRARDFLLATARGGWTEGDGGPHSRDRAYYDVQTSWRHNLHTP